MNGLKVIHQRGQFRGGGRGESRGEVKGDSRSQDNGNLCMRSGGMREESGVRGAKGRVSIPAIELEGSVTTVGNGDRGVEMEEDRKSVV